jgi:uncharacterized cupin superfamily protein
LPGKRSFPFHYHLAQEEALYVLAGKATLRLGDREIALREGDYVALPAGPAHAHQLINSTAEACRYLSLSTADLPEIVLYPDSKKLGLLGGPASSDASGKPLIHVSAHGQTLGYYDDEDE